MLSFLPKWIRGTIAIAIVITNTLFWFPFLVTAALAKLIFPIPIVSKVMTVIAIQIATTWISVNGFIFPLLHKMRWNIHGVDDLSKDDWYLVSCNHQSWADIPIMQKVFNRKIPMLKFFLKQELIWVPVMGICWWALDFPFMKRFSQDFLKKHPEMRGKDMETTKKACEKFKTTPVSVFNFLEGTRYTEAKHQRQKSPFKHLLKPKAGGVAFVLEAMGTQLHKLIDVSIIYPSKAPSFWDLISGEIDEINVYCEVREIPAQFLGKDYMSDEQFRADFQTWISEIWQEKDEFIDRIHSQQNTVPESQLQSA